LGKKKLEISGENVEVYGGTKNGVPGYITEAGTVGAVDYTIVFNFDQL